MQFAEIIKSAESALQGSLDECPYIPTLIFKYQDIGIRETSMDILFERIVFLRCCDYQVE